MPAINLPQILLGDEHTSCLPWQSRPDDWFVAICPDEDEVIYVEHPAVIAIMRERGEEVLENPAPFSHGVPGWARNFTHRYRDYALSLGQAIARYLSQSRPPRDEGRVQGFGFAALTTALRFGFFAGKTFVFLPRPALERPGPK